MKDEEYSLKAVPAGRFLTLRVDWDERIDEFVKSCRLRFEPGRGFYQFKRKRAQLIRENTRVILRDKRTGKLFSGTAARMIIGVPPGERAKVKPFSLPWHDVFIQSFSLNRRLIGGTELLYEAEQNKKGGLL